jgi:hypothetical protein
LVIPVLLEIIQFVDFPPSEFANREVIADKAVHVLTILHEKCSGMIRSSVPEKSLFLDEN